MSPGPNALSITSIDYPSQEAWCGLMTQNNKSKFIHVVKATKDRISRIHRQPQEALLDHLPTEERATPPPPPHAVPILTRDKAALATLD